MWTYPKLPMLLAGALLLAACDGGGGGGDGDDDNAQGIASLGQAFVAAFNQPRNSQPVNAQSTNLALTPQAQPFNP